MEGFVGLGGKSERGTRLWKLIRFGFVITFLCGTPPPRTLPEASLGLQCPIEYTSAVADSVCVMQIEKRAPLKFQEQLWLQPTDQLRLVPQMMRSKPLRNSMQTKSRVPTTTQSTIRNHARMEVNSVQSSCPRELQPVQRLEFYIDLTNARGRAWSTSSYSSGDDCAYCRSVGKPSGGHSKTSCPALHCPSQQKIKLELKEDYLRRADIRRQARMEMRMQMCQQSSVPFTIMQWIV
ncbi:unnamed protein product [Heligmosomoides polygyrus]|uniref:Uncharacterized protein n=1 Tax=Heligmosomoides polygyrus TaxID=6339 RepID=A0A3P8AAY8_HELPZ|nr:unnamed protein product [Heligmosomoides polygyrus]